MDDKLSWAEFEKVEMRVGTIVDVHDFPSARMPAFQLRDRFWKRDRCLKIFCANHEAL
jgi:hypothetical protein